MMSVLLLIMFPVIILGMVWVFLALVNYFGNGYYDNYGNVVHELDVGTVNYYYLTTVPWVIGGVAVWFVVAYFSNASMIRKSVHAEPLSRRDNPRVYNIVENLCMSCGMKMPKVCVVHDPQLNAFASGIDENSYAVTLTTGIIDRLDDEELAGVVAHELTHIRNRDTRLLIISIIFVGIITTVMTMVVRILYNSVYFGMGSRRNEEKNNGLGIIAVLFVGLICCVIAYLFTLMTRFAISRKREYMADAGGAELTRNPRALASALRKISSNPGLDDVGRADVAQLFICEPDKTDVGLVSFMNSLFSTHPDISKRIQVLEQF